MKCRLIIKTKYATIEQIFDSPGLAMQHLENFRQTRDVLVYHIQPLANAVQH